MKSSLKYSILPGVTMAVIFSIYPSFLSILNNSAVPKTFDEDVLALQLILFFVFIYLGTAIFSSILSRKEPFIVSFVLALLSILVMDFMSSLFLGTPILSKTNYRLYDQPLPTLFLTAIVIGLTKAVVHIREKHKLLRK